MAEATNGKQRKKLFLNLLAIVGFVIIIVVVILGLFRLATLSKSWFYSLFTLKPGSIQVTAPSAMKERTSAPSDSAPALSTTPAQSSALSSGDGANVPDLSVRILSAGVIDPISGNVIPREPTAPSDLVAVRFLISNSGNAPTGLWYFTAQLPTSPAYLYSSPAQTSLVPGGSIENMLRFKNAVPSGTFSVTVDPSNQVSESNEGNNTASQRI